MLGDGSANSVTATLYAELNNAERKRILLEYGKVPATYTPAFDPNSVSESSRCANRTKTSDGDDSGNAHLCSTQPAFASEALLQRA